MLDIKFAQLILLQALACCILHQRSDLLHAQEPAGTEAYRWIERMTGSTASLRGFSVVTPGIHWASGAKGTILRTSDSGTSWQSCGPKGFGELDFRSIVAFDDMNACIASAGTPAVILQTHDGGQSWTEVFRHPSPAAFFDGMKFWNQKKGIAFSDPVGGRLLIVTTADGGASWQTVASDGIPLAAEKEGGFAASNSSLCISSHGRAWIGTGGTQTASSRVYSTIDFGTSWKVSSCPIPSGPSEGIFSIAYRSDDNLLVAVGGDYRPEAKSKLTASFSVDMGNTWQSAAQPPDEFVSAICFSKKAMIATGPTCSFISTDGNTWRKFSSNGFHVLATDSEEHVFAVGSAGRFGELVNQAN